MPNPHSSYDDFAKDYDFAQKFGFRALEDKIKNEANLSNVNATEVRSLLLQNAPEINKDFLGLLQDAHKIRKPDMGTYAKQQLKDRNKDIDNQMDARAGQKTPAWPGVEKLDFSNEINRFVRDIKQDKANITQAFDNLRNDLNNRMRNELRMRYAPKPGQAPRLTAKP